MNLVKLELPTPTTPTAQKKMFGRRFGNIFFCIALPKKHLYALKKKKSCKLKAIIIIDYQTIS